LAAGAEVFVMALGKRGRIVEVAAGGRYRVVVGGMTVWCREPDLDSVSHGKKQAKRDVEAATAAATPPRPPIAPTASDLCALGSIDLHGMTVAEALQAVSRRLDEAIRAGLDELEVIHGISGGRLRAAVHGLLAGTTSVARFAPDRRNPGVTRVFF
jgi:dsDNA-specific endonuclease/ATPase MutS2